MNYARSKLGLWVRAVDDPAGVRVEAQERVEVRGGLARGLGADGEERWERPVALAPAAGAWYSVGIIDMGATWEALGVPLLRWEELRAGVRRHVVALVAGGWGDTVAEVVGWFADPGAGACVVPGLYRVCHGVPPLDGFAGELIRAEEILDGAELATGYVLNRLGVRFEVPVRDWVRALLLGAEPVCG